MSIPKVLHHRFTEGLLAFALCSVTAAAQEAKPTVPSPNDWAVRVYRFPADELRMGFVSRERGQIKAPAMPPADASQEQILQFIKSSNDVVAQYLELQGIPLLKGSLAVLDPEHDVLAVRTVNDTHNIITELANAFLRRVPRYLSFHMHLMEADPVVMAQLVKDAPQNADQTPLWERIKALADQGQAKHLSSMNIDSQSGQRSFVKRGAQRAHADGFSMDDRDRFEVPASRKDVGTRLELDPVIGPDGTMVDVNFGLEHDLAPPVERWEPAAQSGTRRIESRVTDFTTAKFTSATMLLSGMTKLLGIWTPEAGANRGNVSQAAFLKGEVVPLLPLTDARAEQLLKTHGETVEATPPPPKSLPNEGLPPGMILRRFRVPPDFLSAAGGGGATAAPAAPADPFVSGVPPRNEPRFTREVTALDILKMNGITFPEGSSANFVAVAGEIIVRNTPENMLQVEAFLDELSKKVPAVVGFAVHVVQAEGALMRRLGAEMNALADHTAAFKAVEDAVAQGKAKILRTAWIETRSGQRCTASTGTEYMHVGTPYLGRPVKDGKEGAAASSAGAVLSVEHETQFVGFRFEADPVIGPDGQTIDVNMALHYDTAPPSQRFAPAGGADSVLRVDSPATDFHRSEVSTAITLKSGATRLLGTWKPEGSPELDDADVMQAAFMKVDLILVGAVGNSK